MLKKQLLDLQNAFKTSEKC